MDASQIILGYKSPQIATPQEQQAKALTLKNLLQTNDLNELKVGEAKDAITQRDLLRKFIRDNPNATANDILRGTGDVETGMKYGKYEDERNTSKLTQQKSRSDIANDRTSRLTNHAMAVYQNPTPETYHAGIDQALQDGDIDQAAAEQAHLNIPPDLKGWGLTHARLGMSAEKQLPKTDTQNLGGSVQDRTIDPLTGVARVTGETMLNDPNKAFNLNPNGEAVPNKPFQDYEITKATAGSNKPPSGYINNPDGSQSFIPGGPADPKNKLKVIPASVNTALTENKKSLSNIDTAIKLLEGEDVNIGKDETGADINMLGDKDATGWKGYVPPVLLNRLDPKGTDARAQVADIGSLIIHDRSGAAVTISESPRLMPFIPLATDDNPTVLKKLRRLKKQMELENDSFAEQYNEDNGYQASNAGSSGGGGSNLRMPKPKGQSKVIGGVTYYPDGKGGWLQE